MKPRSRSQNSASSSRLCLSSKRNINDCKNSIKNSETISKYFASDAHSEINTESATEPDNQTNLEEDLSDTNEELPYMNSLTEIKRCNVNTSVNEEKDFKTPKRINKEPFKTLRGIQASKCTKTSSKPGGKKRGRKPKVPKDKKSKQMIFTKTIKENLNGTDVNPEHLQVAIALSRSLQDNYKREKQQSDSNSTIAESYLSTQQKVASLKETLKQFGFKANTEKIEVQNRRALPERKKKKSRYQCITPILLLRTEEDRQNIISEKTALILSQNAYDNEMKFSTFNSDIEIKSKNLQKYWRDDNKIFKMSNFEIENLNNSNIFYVPSLNIPKTVTECGSLMKDWSKIPGRKSSPIRNTGNVDETKTSELSADQTYLGSKLPEITTDSDKINVLSCTLKSSLQIKSFTDRSISPELFSSDDEVIEISSSPIHSQKSEQHTSPYLLNSTPSEHNVDEKTNSIRSIPVQNSDCLLHSSPDGEVSADECSESLLNLTPSKRKMKTTVINTYSSPADSSKSLLNRSSSSSEKNSIKNKYKLSDLSDDDLFENENGICTFETFSKENNLLTQHCFDLTESDSEENTLKVNKASNEAQNVRYSSSNRTSRSCIVDKIISPNKTASPAKTGISEIMQKAVCLRDETIDDMEITYEASRRSKSLNITDYICNILNEQEFIINPASDESTGVKNSEQPKQNIKADDDVFDLTQSTPDSSCSDPASNTVKQHVNERREGVSGLNTEEPTKSVGEDDGRFKKHEPVVMNAQNEILSIENKDYALDLTQNSPDSVTNKLKLHVNKIRNERISSSSDDSDLSPIKIKQSNTEAGYTAARFKKHDSFNSTTSDEANLSQSSIWISDEELNYSSVHSMPYNDQREPIKSKSKFLDEFSESEDSVNEANMDFTPTTSKETQKFANNSKNVNPDVDSSVPSNADLLNNTVNDNQPVLQHPRIESLSRENTPTGKKIRKSLFNGPNLLDDSFNGVLENSNLFTNIIDPSTACKESETSTNNTTPKREMIIKTSNVTPMTNYDEMDTPKITKELKKFGLKPLKRRRGAQILKHIYESTHPLVGEAAQSYEKSQSDEEHRVTKRRKTSTKPEKSQSDKEHRVTKGRKTSTKAEKSQSDEEHRVTKRRKTSTKAESKKISKKPGKNKSPRSESSEIDLNECDLENVSKQYQNFYVGQMEQIEIVGDLMAKNETVEDLIFERKQSSKISSCRVPLHIAWHNLVSSQPDLKKNILLFEPIQLEVLYMALKEQGYKYHIQDLLTFLDKKCITIRTNQNSNRRRQKKKKSPSKKS